MYFFVRCDSSNIIGSGHVMRCLNYIESSRVSLSNLKIIFICRSYPHNISKKIIEKKYELVLLPYEIDPCLDDYTTWIGTTWENEIIDIIKILKRSQENILLIDHYGIDYKIEMKLKPYCKKMIVITDLLNQSHFCDLYINYNTNNLDIVKKHNLYPETKYHIGLDHLIINKEFKTFSKKVMNGDINKIGIMFGGADPQNMTLQILQKISVLHKKITVFVVIGFCNMHKESIIEYCDGTGYMNYFFDLNYLDLIKLYNEMDLCIGSLSITAYERLYMNVPQICLKIAKNQNVNIIREEFNLTTLEEIIEVLKKKFNVF